MFLAGVGTNISDSWRNFGLMWVYIFFNLAAALFLYWLGRVPKDWGRGKDNTATETTSSNPGRLEDAPEQSGKTSPTATSNGEDRQEKQE